MKTFHFLCLKEIGITAWNLLAAGRGLIQSPCPAIPIRTVLPKTFIIYIRMSGVSVRGLLFKNDPTPISDLKHNAKLFVNFLNVSPHGFQPHLKLF